MTLGPAKKGIDPRISDGVTVARANEMLTGSRGEWCPPPQWRLRGRRVLLRLATVEDCTPRYLGWLRDPYVNQFLETRWHHQSTETIRQFVDDQVARPDSWLFAIVDQSDGMHVGNIKVGPKDAHHNNADLSYFIGERDRWGQGLATEAISLAVWFSFRIWNLDRLQAGVYANNVGSMRVLEKAGFQREGCLRKHLIGATGREDLFLFGLLRHESSHSQRDAVPVEDLQT